MLAMGRCLYLVALYCLVVVTREPSSGSPEFDRLRSVIATDRQLRNDLEAALLLIVETYNPSDRGVRFITGGIGEWILAFAAYAAGVVSMPAGHNEDGFDLMALIGRSRELWSAKGSNSRGGTFTITNGQGGPGVGFVHPTVFWSPDLPGFVYADPMVHRPVVVGQVQRRDATVIKKSVIAQHAAAHPECVAEIIVPDNPGTATKDPSFEAVKLLIEGGNFPRLRRMLDDSTKADPSVVGQLRELQAMLNSGLLTEAQYNAAVAKVTSQ